jgi:hypothetical protein
MLKYLNFKRSLGEQPREGVVHGPNPCTHPPPPSPHLFPPPFPPSPWGGGGGQGRAATCPGGGAGPAACRGRAGKAACQAAGAAPPLGQVAARPWPPPPRARGERGRKEGGRRGARDSTLPLPFQGQPCPIFGQGRQILGIVLLSQPALPKNQKKPLGQYNFFSTTPN